MLSETSRQTLLDLVEIKLSCLEVWDRDDRRELENLERARRELEALAGASALAPAGARPRRGRPPVRQIVGIAAI